jgi:hypothetical protein
MECSGNEAFFIGLHKKNLTHLAKGVLGKYVYWTRLLSLNRIKSGDVTSLLTGHNTLRRYTYIMGMIGSPSGRRCWQRRKPQLIFCEYEAMATLRHTYLGSFFLDPEDVRSLGLGGGLKLY